MRHRRDTRMRELRREHVHIVQTANQSVAMNMLYPYPTVGARAASKKETAAASAAASAAA